MKKLAFVAVFAVATTSAVAVDVDNGNSISKTITGAATGYLIRPLEVTLVDNLILPDLVIPATGNTNNYVTLDRTSGGDVITYSENGKPGVDASENDLNDWRNSAKNSNSDASKSYQFGLVRVTGHSGRAISLAVAKPTGTGSPTLAGDNYEFEIETYGLTFNGEEVLGDAADSSASGAGTFDIEFGGTLRAAPAATPGAKSQDLLVTVSYR